MTAGLSSGATFRYGISPSDRLRSSRRHAWLQSLKAERPRPGVPLSIEVARRLMGRCVDYYNRDRVHSVIGYMTPLVKLEDREIVAARDPKLEDARQQRQLWWQEASRHLSPPPSCTASKAL